MAIKDAGELPAKGEWCGRSPLIWLGVLFQVRRKRCWIIFHVVESVFTYA